MASILIYQFDYFGISILDTQIRTKFQGYLGGKHSLLWI